VRFIQIPPGDGAAGAWDSHSGLKKNHTSLAQQVDQPISGLLKDLKQRGMLDDTLVVFATEFGRTPGTQGSDGRDHHPYGFSVWMAGGGIKGGTIHGATDELGFHPIEHPHYVTDVHATILNLLGLNPHQLEIPGRKRLERDFGHVIREIIA
jgi:arylsulfatase A-like enzyme